MELYRAKLGVAAWAKVLWNSKDGIIRVEPIKMTGVNRVNELSILESGIPSKAYQDTPRESRRLILLLRDELASLSCLT